MHYLISSIHQTSIGDIHYRINSTIHVPFPITYLKGSTTISHQVNIILGISQTHPGHNISFIITYSNQVIYIPSTIKNFQEKKVEVSRAIPHLNSELEVYLKPWWFGEEMLLECFRKEAYLFGNENK